MEQERSYSKDRIAPESLRPSRSAFVMHGTRNGRFVAITIRVPGSSWVCHPARDEGEWFYFSAHHKHKARPVAPRWVRKAAKMALRRWLTT